MEEFITPIINSLKNNEIFSGVTFGTMITTGLIGIIYSLKQAPKYIIDWIIRNLTISLEINNNQNNYSDFKLWFQKFNNKNIRTYILDSVNNRMSNSKVVLIPGSGTHWVIYNWRILHIKKHIEKNNTGGVFETVIITTFGITQKYIKKLSDEIINTFDKTSKIQINNVSEGYYWNESNKYKRYLNTFVLNNKHEIINDIRLFLSKKEWYHSKGILYKKGLLLYGEPGTGKSTFASILATELNLEIYYINLSDKETVSNLLDLTSKIRENSIILFEDIDCLGMAHSRDEDIKNKDHLSLFLNILDGVNSLDSVIYLLTTNYIDKIDKALIRPGRIDTYIKFEKFKKPQIQELYNIFYDRENDFNEFYINFKHILINDEISPSNLQNLFIHYPDSKKLILDLNNNPEHIKEYILRD